MITIHAVRGGGGPGLTPFGCTYIRLIQPFTYPSLADRVRFTHGPDPPPHRVDVAIVERYFKEDTRIAEAERLYEDLRKRAKTIVYTLDDNILDLNLERPWEPFPKPETRAVVRFFLQAADSAIVSTPALRERLRPLNARIEVVPNALDDRLFPNQHVPRTRRAETVVGYMGTLTHDRDLMLVVEPLRRALRRNRNLRLELVGLLADPRLAQLFAGLPVAFRDPRNDHTYPRFVTWMRNNLAWDLAIAPLEDTPFTSAKSDLKFLDYSALSFPSLLSDVRPYQDAPLSDGLARLVPNEPDAWADALDELVGNDEARLRLAERAYEHVSRERMLKTRSRDFLAAVENLIP